IFKGKVWQKLMENGKGGALHFIGLFSDGNVHSHIDHLKAMLEQALKDGVTRARIHTLLDGRDVGETSALDYIDPFEDFLSGLNEKGGDFRIASGGGRMNITMDRYGANWDMVKRGWDTHVLATGRTFGSAHKAIETLREETGAIDQDLPAFVIADESGPVGPIKDGDAVIYFNFRGDRALEMTSAFEKEEFNHFDRGPRPAVEYAGMMEYDGDLHVPAQYLVEPPAIDRTVGEYLAGSGINSFAISETQKFGHVTYFYNGNRTGKFDEEREEYVEITSDIVPFEERPWMKAADITDQVLEAMKSGKYEYIRLNYPNGDMVGHTGNFEAAICAMTALDLSIGRLEKMAMETGAVLILTADHGNVDDMYEHDKKTGDVTVKENGTPKAKTSHSLNPVPCVIVDPGYQGEYAKELVEGLGISSLAATCIEFLGFDAPDDYDASVLKPSDPR
ncbi:MAG: 2,3-bisphosphoglycerate-independent phosphoglycerate mutase, partial [Spirochaetales bacterium]|nr:2,3-bisphosphoglycerate-independent phosphoglycerate mutase [Spirochaetales bacterium]